MSELIIGAGHRKQKVITPPNSPFYTNPVTLDINPDCEPDIVFEMGRFYYINSPLKYRMHMPSQLEDNQFDEIHAYECLEHWGEQGNIHQFFAEFREYWRLLKPDGVFCASTPTWDGLWAWGDPGHKRVINEGTLVFLSQKCYEEQLGKSPMSDYRYLMGDMDWSIEWTESREGSFLFVLKALKPA